MTRLMLVLVLLCSGTALAGEAAGGTADPFTGGSADAGATKAATCFACHGPGGNSANPEWPKLAGQHSAYLYRSLQMLKMGHRQNPVMNAQAAPLSDQDMRDLAAYFASQAPTPGVGSPDAVKVAERIYRAGDAARQLPACEACHGPQGRGNAGAGYPRIGGQHAKYAAGILQRYKSQSGMPMDSAPTTIMAAVAAKLSDAEIQALASYVNGLH